MTNNQQSQIIDKTVSGTKQIICGNAGAGTGKTTTSVGTADAFYSKAKTAYYFIFNKANAEEAKVRFPKNTRIFTNHGFSFGSTHPDTRSTQKTGGGLFGNLSMPDVNNRVKTMAQCYGSRLTGSLYGPIRDLIREDQFERRQAMIIADDLNLRQVGKVVNVVQGVLRKYCQSIDKEISAKHIPMEVRAHIARSILGSGATQQELRRFKPDERFFDSTIQVATRIFTRMRDINDKFPVDHAFYLKLASLDPPIINTDLIILDEAQDASPPVVAILEAQLKRGTQLLLIGDTYQHIYGFTGAMDTMTYMAKKYPDITETLPLTQSYRFGQPIADAGNTFLSLLGAPNMLEGVGAFDSHVNDLASNFDGPHARLYRGNISLINDVITETAHGRSIYINGNGNNGKTEQIKLLQGVSALFNGEFVSHPELSLFEQWQEFKDYSDTPDGSGFAPIVKFVERNNGNVDSAINAIQATSTSPDGVDIVMSTAHKSKGLEWDRVLLSSDFQRGFLPEDDVYSLPSKDELALLYVASTRAQETLATNGLLSAVSACIRNLDPALVEQYSGENVPNLSNADRIAERLLSQVPPPPTEAKALSMEDAA